MLTPLRRQVLVPAPSERVWRALTDPEEAGTWLGGRIEWTVEEGRPLRFDSPESGPMAGRIDVVRPGRYLRFSWWPTPDPEAGPGSEVSYLLEPEGPATRLTVQERPVDSPVDRTVAVSPQASVSATGLRWSSADDAGLRAWASQSLSCVG